MAGLRWGRVHPRRLIAGGGRGCKPASAQPSKGWAKDQSPVNGAEDPREPPLEPPSGGFLRLAQPFEGWADTFAPFTLAATDSIITLNGGIEDPPMKTCATRPELTQRPLLSPVQA